MQNCAVYIVCWSELEGEREEERERERERKTERRVRPRLPLGSQNSRKVKRH